MAAYNAQLAAYAAATAMSQQQQQPQSMYGGVSAPSGGGCWGPRALLLGACSLGRLRGPVARLLLLLRLRHSMLLQLLRSMQPSWHSTRARKGTSDDSQVCRIAGCRR